MAIYIFRITEKHKRAHVGFTISYNFFLQEKVRASKEKMNLQLPLPYYHSLLFMIEAFIIEAVFISEQINQCKVWCLVRD